MKSSPFPAATSLWEWVPLWVPCFASQKFLYHGCQKYYNKGSGQNQVFPSEKKSCYVDLSAKGPSKTSVAALGLFYYLQLYACKWKIPPLLHLFLCYTRWVELLSFKHWFSPYYFLLLTCSHHRSECTVLGTAHALENFLAGGIYVPDFSFVNGDTKIRVQLTNLQGLEPLLCTVLWPWMTPKATCSGQSRPFQGKGLCTLSAYGVMVTYRALCVMKESQVSKSSSKKSSVSWIFLRRKSLRNTLYFFYE